LFDRFVDLQGKFAVALEVVVERAARASPA